MFGPDFILAGGHKCATTTLYALLDSHPAIEMSSVKEPHFLARESLAARLHDGVWTEDEYQRLWSTSHLRGEASVLYLNFAGEVIRAVRETFDEPPLILLTLRNPVDRAYSSYVDARLTSPDETAPTFEEAIVRERARKVGDLGGSLTPTVHHLALGFYSPGIKAFQEAFGKDRVCVVLFEEFRDRPDDIWAELQRRLGVDLVDLPTVERQNQGGREWRPGLASRIARGRLAVTARRTLRRRLPSMHKALRGWALARMAKPTTGMKPQTRDLLTAYYEGEVRELSTLLDRDLSLWWRA